MALKTLTEYLDSLPPLPKPEASGVSCPHCSTELEWDEPSLFLVNPPMRRLICRSADGCRDFSQVVPLHRGAPPESTGLPRHLLANPDKAPLPV